ncbi:Frag1/DRAM/Sfk1 [Trinorchestia longiramus]|nr:Frag1/DRAM/Sfk1 [Trinorchestia longiramus]
MSSNTYLHLLPLSVFFIFPATFLVTYSISVLLGHTEPDFPYISDTGTYSPESCIFGQAINMGACLVVLTVYVRYRQLSELYQTHSAQSNILRANRAAAIVGCLSAFGMSLSANFQETNVISVHLVGAVLAFGGSTLYIWLQAVCSYETHPVLNSMAMAHLRLSLGVVAAAFFTLGCVCAVIAHSLFDGTNARKWYPSNGGWTYHVVSTASEWICASTFAIFMLTLVPEFKTVSMDSPQIFIAIETLSPYNSGIYNSVESINGGSGSGSLPEESNSSPSGREVRQVIVGNDALRPVES